MDISTVVKYRPYSLGRNPVMATPAPSSATDSRAKVCSFSTNRTNTAVNARKPGNSRKLCRMPISRPVKAACSMAKLFSKACHTEKASDAATPIRISKYSGLLILFLISMFAHHHSF